MIRAALLMVLLATCNPPSRSGPETVVATENEGGPWITGEEDARSAEPPSRAGYDLAVASERSGKYRTAEQEFGTSCATGDARSCRRQAGYHVIGIGPFKRDLRLGVDILAKSCESLADHESCALDLFIREYDKHLGSAASSRFTQDQWHQAEARCQAQKGASCVLLGVRAFVDRDEEAAAKYLMTACKGAANEACVLAFVGVAVAHGRPAEDVRDALATGCSTGNGEACAAYAGAFFPDAVKSMQRQPEMEKYLENACKAEPTANYIGSVGAPGTPMVGGTCALLSLMYVADGTEEERKRAQKLRARACDLGVETMCKQPDVQ